MKVASRFYTGFLAEGRPLGGGGILLHFMCARSCWIIGRHKCVALELNTAGVHLGGGGGGTRPP